LGFWGRRPPPGPPPGGGGATGLPPWPDPGKTTPNGRAQDWRGVSGGFPHLGPKPKPPPPATPTVLARGPTNGGPHLNPGPGGTIFWAPKTTMWGKTGVFLHGGPRYPLIPIAGGRIF